MVLHYIDAFKNSSLSHLDEVTEDLYIQFVSSSDSSAQYKISEITSDREITTSAGDNPPTQYYVTIDTDFKNDIDFIFDNPGNPSYIDDLVKIQFTKAVVENKPKYDGRFFAKIENDGKIKSQITDDSLGVNYLIKARKMVYVLNNDQELQSVSGNAHFSDYFRDRINNPYTVLQNINLVRENYYNWISSSFVGGNNVDGINFNFLYARQAYFGCAFFDEQGPMEYKNGSLY